MKNWPTTTSGGWPFHVEVHSINRLRSIYCRGKSDNYPERNHSRRRCRRFGFNFICSHVISEGRLDPTARTPRFSLTGIPRNPYIKKLRQQMKNKDQDQPAEQQYHDKWNDPAGQSAEKFSKLLRVWGFQ